MVGRLVGRGEYGGQGVGARRQDGPKDGEAAGDWYWDVECGEQSGETASIKYRFGVPTTFRIADPIRSVPEWRG